MDKGGASRSTGQAACAPLMFSIEKGAPQALKFLRVLVEMCEGMPDEHGTSER